MFKTIAELQVPYILMHMQGTPQNMQKNPSYENVTKDLISFFAAQIFELRQLQVKDVIIDVGFGFGKTLVHNYQLLKTFYLYLIFLQVVRHILTTFFQKYLKSEKVLGTSNLDQAL